MFKHSLDASWEKLSDFFPNSAHCNGVRSFAQSRGCWVTGDYQVGDLLIFDWNGDGSGDHIGIIESVTNSNAFTTIEGNHNDAVARVTRSTSGVIGAYRPEYEWAGYEEAAAENEPEKDINVPAKEPENVPDINDGETEEAFLKMGDINFAVGVLQYALHKRGYDAGNSRQASGDWDGEYGEGTQLALDRFCNRNGAVCTEELFIEICKGAKRK